MGSGAVSAKEPQPTKMGHRMKTRFIQTGVALFLASSLYGCTAGEHRSWEFIQKVGGLNLVGQDKDPGWLIVRGDVSGLQEFSTKPTQLNSALAVKKVEAVVRDKRIQIFVVTTLAGKMYPSSEIRGADISGIKRGTYLVQYLNPDNSTVDLREININ